MKNPKLDLIGKTFGQLLVLHRVPHTTKHPKWLCQCSCGSKKEIIQPCLITGNTKSCGCLKEQMDKAKRVPLQEKKKRRALAASIKDKQPVRREEKRINQMKYVVTDKALLAAFHRFVNKRKNKLEITDAELLKFREAPCVTCSKKIEGAGNSFILIKPRGPISLDNMIPMCGICKLIKPKDKFDPIVFSKQIIRRFWKKTPMASIAKQKARKARGRYECAKCLHLCKEKEVELDHIIPVVDPVEGYKDLETWCTRLLCDENNLQYLCKICHSDKTTKENEIRNRIKKLKKLKK